MKTTVRRPNMAGLLSLAARLTTVPVTGPSAAVCEPVIEVPVAVPGWLVPVLADALAAGAAPADPAASALPFTTTQSSGVPAFWHGLGWGASLSTTSWPSLSVGLSQLLARLGSGPAPGMRLA